MSFLDIKEPAKRATLVKEYVTPMKTVKQRNMTNREMKLAIGDELQTLFHPIVNATKQAAEETRKELAPTKKTLTDIDGALAAQRATDARPPLSKNTDTTFGLYGKQDRQLSMGNKVVRLDVNSLKLILTGQTVKHVNYPGQAHKVGIQIPTLIRLLIMVDLIHGYLIRLPNPTGSFQCAIPMRHIRFCGMIIQR